MLLQDGDGSGVEGDDPPGSSVLGFAGSQHRLALERDQGEAFLAVMAGKDPATGASPGCGEGSVRGYDATFSAPKSVSVLWGVACPPFWRV